MSAQSWYDRDVSEVADLLAKEAVARDLVKAADLPTSLRDFGSQAMDYAAGAGKRLGEFGANFGNKAREYGNQALGWLNEPGSEGLRQGLAGAGIGGLLGLGSQLYKDPEERQYGNSAIMGAAAGGALGGGLGLIRQHGGPSPGGNASPPVEQQIEEINKQIAEQQQAQAAQQVAGYGAAARQGAGMAGATLGTHQFLHNRPSQLLRRGAEAATLGNYGEEAQEAIKNIRTSPAALPLNQAWLSSRFSPGMKTTYQSASEPDGLLRAFLRDENSRPPKVPSRELAVRTGGGPAAVADDVIDMVPRRRFSLFADPKAMNSHLPGLTNAQVRQLGRLSNAKLPGRFMGMGLAGLGLLPIAMNYLGNQGVQQQQQDFAQSLAGGLN